MAKQIVDYLILFIILVLAQVLIFNHILLFGVASPIIFIYFIIRLPMSVKFNALITLAFFLGLLVDICSNTIGMNALACVIFAALKKPLLLLYVQHDDYVTEIKPTISTLGLWIYSKFLITTVLVYCLLYFSIEFFSIINIGEILLMSISSALLSFLLLLGIDSLMMNKREQRL